MYPLAALRLSFLSLIFLFSTLPIVAQNPTKKAPKFGKISVPNLAKTANEKFPNAHAVVLFDYGNTSYDFSIGNGSIIKTFERHVAIQFFDNEAFDEATFRIYLREAQGNREKLGRVRGYTYNLENGKYNRTKLSKKNIFTEEIQKGLKVRKFTMPNVKEGSIIEVKYSYDSYRYWDLPNWSFQKTIPTLYSEYNIAVPEFFVFTKNFLGFYAPYIKPTDRALLQNEFTVFREGWVMTDLPAFEEEDYMRSYINYMSRIDFELQMIKYPSGGVESFTQTWKDVRDDLMKSSEFGEIIKKRRAVKDIVSQIPGANDKAHMVQLFEHVKTHMKWDGEPGLFSQKGAKESLKDGTGDAADINLTLIAALQTAGFNVKPVVLSTRSNGMIPMTAPTIDHLNYVIAAVDIDDKRYFLDATEDYLPAATVPVRCLNGEAVMLHENGAQPFLLQPTGKYKTAVQHEMTLNEEGVLEGVTKKTKLGYAAIYFRKDMTEAVNEKKLIEKMEEENEGLSIQDHSIENYDDVYQPIKEKYQVTIEGKVMEAGDLIYLNPMLYDGIEENPFKLEKRQYPVDFAIPIEETYVFKFKIPEGYVVETLPEAARFSLPDKASSFSFSAKVLSNEIQVISRLKINKTLFVETEYAALKKYHDLIIKSHAEQIVLKKQ